MYASVELQAESETLLLPARNISLGGVYLDADGHDLAAFEIGAEVEVLVLDALDDSREPVRLVAEIVRHDGGGLALMWAESEAGAVRALAALLDRLQPRESGDGDESQDGASGDDESHEDDA